MSDVEQDGSSHETPEPTAADARAAKIEALRRKMLETTKANRADLVAESQQHKTHARDAARLDRQRRLAETLRQNADAEAGGQDVERARNWEYTVEENDAWEKRLARKTRRADFRFHDEAATARTKYKKDLDLLKPDLAAYNAQKEAALGLAPGTLAGAPSAEQLALVVAAASAGGKSAVENLYRDANTLLYADNKPAEEAIDRVVNKLNNDLDKRRKFSRKRPTEDQGDITYINERNRVFNKKIARYYDKYTTEIRASFERGTAL